MIGDLRNPTLKPRHWEMIEEVIAFHFTPEEPMTLGKLVEIDAFQHTEAIEEVSGKASSEASLEAILKKVSSLIFNQLGFLVNFYLFVELIIPINSSIIRVNLKIELNWNVN